MNILLSTADNPNSCGLHVFSKSSEHSCISFPNQHEMSYDRSRLDSLWKKGLESGVRRSPAMTQDRVSEVLSDLERDRHSPVPIWVNNSASSVDVDAIDMEHAHLPLLLSPLCNLYCIIQVEGFVFFSLTCCIQFQEIAEMLS
ncbi:hypothetical protein HJG60_012059 [Phyllostomus discolor]|uniref:Uncharacterized protein n=1 Tax=Phyllostomus discolor TaxID=89673 RepID=A0A833ZM79_9CHIR|nr:hypothetical protein HJG60_012059 [Phyllostomus discolor]